MHTSHSFLVTAWTETVVRAKMRGLLSLRYFVGSVQATPIVAYYAVPSASLGRFLQSNKQIYTFTKLKLANSS